MVFTAASFTVTVVGTAISVLGFIAQVEDQRSRYARVGWLMLLILAIAYLAGMAAILAPSQLPSAFLPGHSVLVTVLLFGVGLLGTLASAALGLPRRAPVRPQSDRWIAWGRIGLIMIPLITVVALAVWL